MTHATGYEVPSGARITLTARVRADAQITFRFDEGIDGDGHRVRIMDAEQQMFYDVLENFKRIQTFSRPVGGDKLITVKLRTEGVEPDRRDSYIDRTINDLFAAVRHALEGPSGTTKNKTTKVSTKGKKPQPVKRDLARSKK